MNTARFFTREIRLFAILAVLSTGVNYSQSDDGIQLTSAKKFRIVFYNTENLFHPSDDPVTNDESFTPGGDHHWTFSRYRKKIDDVSRCLALTGENGPPSVIGLAEIENKQVLSDLTASSWLTKNGYKIIHKDSPDRRGIDTGLLYDPEVFKPEHYEIIGLDTVKYHIYTRDMIYVEGRLYDKATIHFFIVHWPSRRGGQVGSENRRVLVAGMLRDRIIGIYQEDAKANILIMGDFNDNPEDVSVSKTLKAVKPGKGTSNQSLINLMFPLAAKNEGSYCLQHNFPEWDNLDQIIVSGALLNGVAGLRILSQKAYIFREDWLMDPKRVRPYSTYLGPRYQGGFSDHLPVYTDIEITGDSLKANNTFPDP
jgi:hypothetical protein